MALVFVGYLNRKSKGTDLFVTLSGFGLRGGVNRSVPSLVPSLKGYITLKKYLTLFKRHFIPFVAFGFVASNVFADAAPTLSEFHPTVVASLGEEKIAVFF